MRGAGLLPIFLSVIFLAYFVGCLSLGATGGRQTIHRLLAKAFIANPDNLPCVLHWDDDPLNNDLGNLRWGTMTENIKDRERNKARRAASIEEARKC